MSHYIYIFKWNIYNLLILSYIKNPKQQPYFVIRIKKNSLSPPFNENSALQQCKNINNEIYIILK